MQRAMAQFVRSIQSFDSKYDAGRAIAPNDGAPIYEFHERGKPRQATFSRASGSWTGRGAGLDVPPAINRRNSISTPNSGHNGVIASLGGGQDLTNTRAPSLRDVVNSEGLAMEDSCTLDPCRPCWT